MIESAPKMELLARIVNGYPPFKIKVLNIATNAFQVRHQNGSSVLTIQGYNFFLRHLVAFRRILHFLKGISIDKAGKTEEHLGYFRISEQELRIKLREAQKYHMCFKFYNLGNISMKCLKFKVFQDFLWILGVGTVLLGMNTFDTISIILVFI